MHAPLSRAASCHGAKAPRGGLSLTMGKLSAIREVSSQSMPTSEDAVDECATLCSAGAPAHPPHRALSSKVALNLPPSSRPPNANEAPCSHAPHRSRAHHDWSRLRTIAPPPDPSPASSPLPSRAPRRELVPLGLRRWAAADSRHLAKSLIRRVAYPARTAATAAAVGVARRELYPPLGARRGH